MAHRASLGNRAKSQLTEKIGKCLQSGLVPHRKKKKKKQKRKRVSGTDRVYRKFLPQPIKHKTREIGPSMLSDSNEMKLEICNRRIGGQNQTRA